MSTDTGSSRGAAGGVLLLCRAGPDAVAPVVPLLRERTGIAGAGDGWTLLVPEGEPWRNGETVERVATGWAFALAVGVSWPVLAVWWDADRSGCVLASGFRRPVPYVWLGNGTAVGEDEAMRTLGEGLGLGAGAGAGALLALTRPEPSVDGIGRLRGLLAALAGLGLRLPDGVAPGETVEGLREVVREVVPEGAVRERVEMGGGVRAAGARAGAEAGGSGVSGGTGARVVAWVQVGLGVPVLVWGVRRRRAGWVVAGLVLVGDGVVGGVRAGAWGRA
ncbi:hypothetical protein ACFZAO_16290 [Streptomyces griseoaurantiacus]|uniref:hypothetical protein n=1 Tax=Streptomyces griseoaurantiacus TaxID=68213 RepID=UPI0036E98567